MKAFLLLCLVFACFAFARCTPSSSETPQAVYGKIVSAGCIAPSIDGVQAVIDEHNRVDQPPWLACLFQGGTVPSCHVPCGP